MSSKTSRSSFREYFPYCVGKWLPSDEAILQAWLKKLIAEVKASGGFRNLDATGDDPVTDPVHSSVRGMLNLIDTDPEVNMFFHEMFVQLPRRAPYINNPRAARASMLVTDYREAFRLVNAILTRAPTFHDSGLIGVPITAIFNFPMSTPSGYACFLNDKVNVHWRNILNSWGTFLKSPDSCYTLTSDPGGWFSEEGLDAMKGFVDLYKCDPQAAHYGFKSFDEFFVREFKDGVRPVASPNDNKVIANACESSPFNIQRNVQAQDRFWIKSQPYSIQFMFNNDPIYEKFVGGTVYQAFLSQLYYHRWHSPVDGTVIKATNIAGAYYSITQSIGAEEIAPPKSQGYLTEVGARAIIVFNADNPYIGLVAFMAVGMTEISSNEITVYEGQRVKKGDQIGMFHYGGSSHCLIFGPGVDVTFYVGDMGLDSDPINVRSKIATVPE